jgi:membrane protease YdiL (CAAX protease family)
LQAALFALWHVMWPIKYLITGQVSVGGAVVKAATLLVGTSLIGVLYGCLYLKTSNLSIALRPIGTLGCAIG